MITADSNVFAPIGALPLNEAAIKLRELGEIEAADLLENEVKIKNRGLESYRPSYFTWPFQDRPWQYTSHAFGFIGSQGMEKESWQITYAGNIQPNNDLKNSQVKITLNELRVADYPGGSTHNILFEFQARNQTKESSGESVQFSTYLRAKEGQKAAVLNMPIFLGLNVGLEGLSFRCQTVNVKNDDDEKMLEFMESDTFRNGLKLLTTAQPAIAPLASLFNGLGKMLLKRNRNVKVQEFYLGLDFNNTPGGARLASGSYIVVQIPDTFQANWDWNKWVYKPTTGNIVSAEDGISMIPYNYIIFGVNRYSET